MSRIADAATAKKRISRLASGQLVPVSDAPLLSSAGTPWAGFLLEIHGPRVVRQDIWWRWHRTHVCVVANGKLNLRVGGASHHEELTVGAGGALIFPSGFGEACFLDRSEFQLICVELDPFRAAACLGYDRLPTDAALVPRFDLEDSQINALLTNMATEIAEGCPGGKLYGQSLSLSLAAYLAARFSAFRRERRRFQRFSQTQVTQLVDYIRTNLGTDLNLSNLAELVRMSPRQFFRLFSNTFGSSPHRYVLEQRVARAKDLLTAKMTLAEIAHTLGFASQSHFTVVFRKATGMSPGRYRAARGDEAAEEVSRAESSQERPPERNGTLPRGPIKWPGEVPGALGSGIRSAGPSPSTEEEEEHAPPDLASRLAAAPPSQKRRCADAALKRPLQG